MQGDADAAIKNPNFDTDADVYNACFGLLDQAIANFALSSPVAIKGDAMYNGNITRWKKLANTLKLRLYMQARLAVPNAATEINKLLAEPGNLITAAGDDFQFQFSKLVAPDNRHPWYQATYVNGNDFTYILHQPMVEMLTDGDPRFPFYFRRQTKQVLDQSNPSERNTTPCSMTVGCQYGYLVLNDNVREAIYGTTDITQDQIDFLAGCFGRDRSDPAGVPLDGDLRLVPGVYPAGGFYDVANPALPGSNAAPGGGIFPIITHVNTLYYQIEAILALGSAGDARALFESAIRSHINKVVNFGKATDANSVSPDAADIDAYVATWLERYDNASTNEAKLNVAMKQLWLSSWGNGYEIFNAMRRTGYPNTIQQPITPVRDFPLRLPYPQVELTLNPNASAYSSVVYDQDPIFWDK
ncbi:MAG: SusD/RagB family nutrient-binding outer membrane lipoprotein [Saprospiraceae bacterium]|nr:SusD/RagB family nutrient-binding outer membrane lipoprotein [Saprospiraceae bacterium]